MKITLPAAYDEEILYAFRALFEGKANDGQQRRAVEWLVYNACHVGLLSFSADDRETAFMEGQRSIALQILKLREPEALDRIKRLGKKVQEAKDDK